MSQYPRHIFKGWAEMDNHQLLGDDSENAQELTILIQELTNKLKSCEDSFSEVSNENTFLQVLIDNLPASIYAKDTQSNHLFSNKVDLQLKGAKTFSDVVGRTDFDFYPKDVAAKFYEDEQKLFRTGISLVNQHEAITNLSSGERRWIVTTKVPLRNEKGEIIGLIGIGHDLTDTKRMEEALAEAHEFIRALSIGSELPLEIPSPHQRRALELLSKLGNRVINTLELHDLLAQVVATAVALIQATSGVIYLVDTRHAIPMTQHVVSFPTDFPYLMPRMDHQSVTLRVIQTGRAMKFADMTQNGEVHPGLHQLGIVAMIALPLIIEKEVIGVLYLHDTKPREFGDVEVSLLWLLIERATVMIQNSLLFEESLRQTKAFNALYKAGQAIAKSHNLEPVLSEIAVQVLSMLGLGTETDVSYSHIALVEFGTLRFLSASQPEILKLLQSRVGNIYLNRSNVGIAGAAVTTGMTQYAPNVNADLRYIQLDDRIKSQLSVPIKMGETVIGVISIESAKEDAFSSEDINFVELLAAQSAPAIDYARLLVRTRIDALKAENKSKNVIAIAQRLRSFSAIDQSENPLVTFFQKLADILPQLCQILNVSSGYLLREGPEKHGFFQIEHFYPSSMSLSTTLYEFFQQEWDSFSSGTGVSISDITTFNRRFGTRLPFHDAKEEGNTEVALIALNGRRRNRLLLIFALSEKHAQENSAAFVPQLSDSRDVFELLSSRLRDIYSTAEHTQNQIKYEQDREQFVEDVMHQLVGPLSGLRAHAEYLKNYYLKHSRTPEQYVTTLDTLVEQAGMFQRYARNFAFVARATTFLDLSKWQFKPFSRNSFVHNLLIYCTKSFHGQAKAFKINGPQVIESTFENFPTLYLAEELIEILLLNLYDNAVKYSFKDRGAPITVVGQVQLPNYVLITITNHGIPLVREDIPHLYERYMRTEGAIAFAPVGTGIGLYLCRQIVQMHGGEIIANPSKPSTQIDGAHEVSFSVRFPIMRKKQL